MDINQEKKNNFIADLKQVFKEHDVHLSVFDQYDGRDVFCGEEVEIKSNQFVGDRLDIYIDNLKELADMLDCR